MIAQARSVLRHYGIPFSARSWSSISGVDPLQQEIEEANALYKGRIAIRKVCDTVGWGLEALCDFSKGELVMKARALEMLDEPHSHTVQVDWNQHVNMDLPARFVNHRCNTANLGVQDNKLGAYDYIALRDISKGEELNWDYEDSEHDLDTPFACTCGDENCRKLVRGWRYAENSGKDPNFLPNYRQTELEEDVSSRIG